MSYLIHVDKLCPHVVEQHKSIDVSSPIYRVSEVEEGLCLTSALVTVLLSLL